MQSVHLVKAFLPVAETNICKCFINMALKVSLVENIMHNNREELHHSLINNVAMVTAYTMPWINYVVVYQKLA